MRPGIAALALVAVSPPWLGCGRGATPSESPGRVAARVEALVTAQEATLLTPDGAPDDVFGVAVALSADGSLALVGASGDDTVGGVDAGSARVFVRSGTTWAEEAVLLAPDGAMGDLFGTDVALSSDGSRAIVGAIYDDTPGGVHAGSARVFVRIGATWTQEATLLAPDGASEDRLGCSVALSSDGSRAVVGALLDGSSTGVPQGSARVFLRTGSTWTQEATLSAPAGPPPMYFGASVALSADGSRAVIGAPEDDTAAGSNAGSARVFLRTGTTWAEEANLLSPSSAVGDWFGDAVALTPDGSRALVAASNRARTHVFLRTGTTWAEEAMLPSTSRVHSVALSAGGTHALIGSAREDTAGGERAGSARVFLRTGATWAEDTRLLAPDGARDDGFGISVAASSDWSRVLVGAGTDTTTRGPFTGSARVFTLAAGPVGSPCGGDAACASGFCVDGVCCATSCGRGTSSCERCSAALTGAADGTCALVSPAVAPSVVCRAAAQPCDVEERCIAGSAICPPDLVVGAGLVCRPAVGECDVAECADTSGACPADTFAPSTTVCGPAVAGACDAADHCTGTSADCVTEYLVGVACRPRLGGCYPAECLGDSPECPTTDIAPAGTVCRPSADLSCDPEEVCDGVGFECPADVTSCGPMDAGRADAGSSADAGSPIDASVRSDTGSRTDATAADVGPSTPPSTPVVGCGCSATTGTAPAALALGILVLLGLRASRGRWPAS